MDTFLWRYTHPRDGRVITKDHFTEAEALRVFPEPERMEGSRAVAEGGGHVGRGFASGLVRREDGAMVQGIGPQIERPWS
jgi:hypothetical protein